jgi:hypothetical protein
LIRQDDDIAGWLASAGHPEGFGDRGLWDECTGVAWDASGQQVWGPESSPLESFKVEIIDGIIRVDLSERVCEHPLTPQSPCITTQ